ncbi:MAG: hypothetical protein ACYC69_11300 [Thermodesulfovibrionales bacterium]
MKNTARLFLLTLLLCSLGCAGTQNQRTENPAKELLAISNLKGMSNEAITRLAEKWSKGEVYVIVHPSYYLFFHEKPFSVSSSEGNSIANSFIETDYAEKSPVIMLMKEYEKAEIEFISAARVKGVPVIFLIPGNYQNSPHYLYNEGPDEYSRYLNGLTQGSDNFVYLESQNVNSGKMTKEHQVLLLNLLKQANIQKVFVGGGYIGRCQKEFYNFLAQNWSRDNIAIIPQISSFSPEDLSAPAAKMLLTSDLKLNKESVSVFIANGGVRKLTNDNRPNLVNTPLSDITR